MEPALPLAALLAAAVVGITLARRHVTRARWLRLLREPRVPARRRRAVRLGPAKPRAVPAGLPAIVVGLCGLILGGPVAAVVAVAYGWAGAVIVRWWRQQRAEAASRRCAVDAVAGLAAELRAGLPVAAALSAAEAALRPPQAVGADAMLVGRRVACAVEVAESSGAPLADVLDRLDNHLRAVDRARAAAEAQAAGARVSALLLSAMPAAGIGLGYAIGIDPFEVLLRTPLGAVCLTGAVALQLSGLAWAARLSRLEAPT